jgi:hypothetical protein
VAAPGGEGNRRDRRGGNHGSGQEDKATHIATTPPKPLGFPAGFEQKGRRRGTLSGWPV